MPIFWIITFLVWLTIVLNPDIIAYILGFFLMFVWANIMVMFFIGKNMTNIMFKDFKSFTRNRNDRDNF